MMKIYQVDAFTDRMFSGNPAGVCILSGTMPDEWMQNVAAEMNLPETAFLLRQGSEYSLRWFAPGKEVDLCGHATLASAHILWETGLIQDDETVRFHTRSGVLTAVMKNAFIDLDFPSEEARETIAPEGLIEGLHIRPDYVGKNRMDYLVEVDSEETVRNLVPDFSTLKKIDTRGIIVTSRSGSKEYDFVSRFFAPGLGVPEDPVTGSAHCCLGPYWETKLEKKEFNAYQASKRGGTVKVRLENDRVILGGRAVTIFDAESKMDREGMK